MTLNACRVTHLLKSPHVYITTVRTHEHIAAIHTIPWTSVDEDALCQ